MKIETLSKLATSILCMSLVSIIIGLFVWWVLVIGIIGLVVFELISAYIHEWHIDQNDEKY